MIADAPPPPLQIPAAPIVPFLCLSIFVNVTRILAPEHPRGCPSETAPPLTFTFVLSIFNFLIFAIQPTEKASLRYQKSTDSFFMLAFLRAVSSADVGLVVNHFGSCDVSA